MFGGEDIGTDDPFGEGLLIDPGEPDIGISHSDYERGAALTGLCVPTTKGDEKQKFTRDPRERQLIKVIMILTKSGLYINFNEDDKNQACQLINDLGQSGIKIEILNAGALTAAALYTLYNKRNVSAFGIKEFISEVPNLDISPDGANYLDFVRYLDMLKDKWVI